MPHYTTPRPAVKAVIVENGCLLVLELRDAQGIYYKLPGGGQERFETMEQALVRECAEEVNLQVQPGKLLWLADHIIDRSHNSGIEQWHQTEAFFRCYITGTASPQPGHMPDTDQVGTAWLPLDEIEHLRLYPLTMRHLLGALNQDEHDKQGVYLGIVS